MLRALDEFEIEGLKTLIPFHRALLSSDQWARGETCRDLVEDRQWLKALAFPPPAGPPAAPEEEQELLEQSYAVEVSGKRFDVRVLGPALATGMAPNGTSPPAAPKPKRTARKSTGRGGGGAGRSSIGGPSATDVLPSPLQGNVWKVLVKQGDRVEEGQLLIIIEAMKMENEITAHKAGTIVELPITEGAAIQAGAPIATIKSDGAAG
jgi:acetyl-CoA/propionyl-CoA carboxylase biotin carboxyl carrier protein